ncbi:MAG TPA: hypothetical protein PKC13_29250, partial [Blastocatellia bacterium]|nr:hypothetical protein [Blastocatellia bacterium]
MFTMSVPESRARLGYLLSEMLSLPHLPEDLHQAVTAHLQQQLSTVNLFKPEYCLRLYPVLAELADLEAKSVDSTMNGHSTAAIEEAAPEVTLEAAPETPGVVPESVVDESVVPESVVVEAVAETDADETRVEIAPEESVSETPENFTGHMPAAAAAE